MNHHRRNTIFGFKNIIITSFILIIDTKLINGAPQLNEHNPKCDMTFLSQCQQKPRHKLVMPFVTSKEELNNACLQFNETVSCMNYYKDHCMTQQQRNLINGQDDGIPSFVDDLCKQGPNQEEFLRHAPCMRRAINGYENCERKRDQRYEWYAEKNPNVSIDQQVCCAMDEFKKCVIKALRELCGEKTAQFYESFLKRNTPREAKNGESNCDEYKDKCGLSKLP